MNNIKLTLKMNNKIIQWIFGYPWDYEIQSKNTLPWALKNYEIVSDEKIPDFVVCVYTTPPFLPEGVKFNEMCFFLSGEKHDRYNKIEKCLQFCQNPQDSDDLSFTRYAPTMCHWVPVMTPNKIKCCSIVESGKWEYRNMLLKELRFRIGDVDVFGNAGSNPLKGWHSTGNEKYKGLKDYAFYISLENSTADDYITEKLWDAFLCDSVPIYNGAPNVNNYLIEGSFIPLRGVSEIDWKNWHHEYEKRQNKLFEQKEFIRTDLNIFSYFVKVINQPELLDKIRPITL